MQNSVKKWMIVLSALFLTTSSLYFTSTSIAFADQPTDTITQLQTQLSSLQRILETIRDTQTTTHGIYTKTGATRPDKRKSFKIIWQLSGQFEKIADAGENRKYFGNSLRARKHESMDITLPQ